MIHNLQSSGPMACLLVFCLCAAGTCVSQSNKPAPTPATPSQPQKKEITMKFIKITPNLMVADMEKSLKFYRDVLGFTVSQTVPEKPPFVFAWMKRGDAELFLNQHMPPQPGQPELYGGSKIGGTLSMYIALEGIEELHKTVENNGVKI